MFDAQAINDSQSPDPEHGEKCGSGQRLVWRLCQRPLVGAGSPRTYRREIQRHQGAPKRYVRGLPLTVGRRGHGRG